MRSKDSSVLPLNQPGFSENNGLLLPSELCPKKESPFRRKFAFCAIVFLVFLLFQLRYFGILFRGATQLGFRIPGIIFTEYENEDGKLGAVASESAVCTRHGTDILKVGGNAADAVSSP